MPELSLKVLGGGQTSQLMVVGCRERPTGSRTLR